MKAFSVKFLNGHFVDQETNKRILPVQGCSYIITASESAFKEQDDKLIKNSSLNSEKKALEIAHLYKDSKHHLILNANTELLFRIGNSKVLAEDSSNEFFLTCTLLEDLYIYSVKNRNKELFEPTSWRLGKCKCQLKDSKLGGLLLTEKIIADSLNELFSKTVMFYYSLQRSGSTNVYDTFFIYEETKAIHHKIDLSKTFDSLGDLRTKIIQKEYPKKHEI